MSERSASKVGGSSFCSVIKKLSTDEPHLIPRVGAHPCPWKKMFRRPRELPVVAAVVGKKTRKEKMTAAGMRKRKNHEGRSKTTSVLCAFLPPIDGRTVIVNPSTSKDFLAFFRARYAIGTY